MISKKCPDGPNELWLRITALDKAYEQMEGELVRIAAERGAASPEAGRALQRLNELGAELKKLYEERAAMLKQPGRQWE